MFEIAGRQIGPEYPPYIIAEVSANHGGSLEKAKKTIAAAAASGAHAVKIQTYTADTMTIDCDREDFMIRGGPWDGYKLYDLYKEAETPFEWHPELFAHARDVGITLFSTPFDETAVELLQSLNAPAYKIASFELVDLPLIECAARTGKPLLMSTGMASEEEVSEALETARTAGAKDILLFHCISSYPAPLDQANLIMVQTLRKRFEVEVGLSDHTIGPIASIASVALGAVAIEKHFTISRSDKGPDSEFSIEPNELRGLVDDSIATWRSLGTEEFQRAAVEAPSLQFRRSVYFVKDLPAGAVISLEDIKRIRPGFGALPKLSESFVGQVLKENVLRGTAATAELIKKPS
jgi:N-acetylneuraminate synthase